MTQDLFALAMQHHRGGALKDAERLYVQILQSDPGHADAWCFLGAIHQAQGKQREAESDYRKAIGLIPHYASALNSLGILLGEQGRLDEATDCFVQVIRHAPEDGDAHNNLGQIYARKGDFGSAVSSYQQALRCQPNHPQARSNLELTLQHRGLDFRRAAHDAKQRGAALAQQGRLEEAKQCFHEALALCPDDADAHNNLSSALILQDRFDEALPHCREALRLRPEFVQALNNLGSILQNRSQVEEAIRIYEQALERNPNYADACYNLANALQRAGRRELAIAAYRRTIDLQPNHVDAHNNLGLMLHEEGQYDAARMEMEHAVRLRPQHGEARWNRAILRLRLGDWQQAAWDDYEWRWRQKGYPQRQFTQPAWDGSDLNGKSILVFAEQGLGDTLQLVRYLPLVKARGGKVILECQPALTRLLTGVAGADRVEARDGDLPAFDVQVATPSLPGIFGTTVETVHANVPYLNADPELVQKWRPLLAGMNGLKIGIAWQGDPHYGHDAQRSIPLVQFAPLAKIADVQLISLQKGFGAEQVPKIAGQFRVHDLGRELDEATGAFMDTAAVMQSLDLVVTSDTAIAHLAGALAVPVWVALPLVPDWRWLLKRDDSPWYPTMRLFRQTQAGSWGEVFRQIATELKIGEKLRK